MSMFLDQTKSPLAQVLAIDPGGTTGTACLAVGGIAPQVNQFPDRHQLYEWLEYSADIPTYYIYESFSIRPGVRTEQLDPLYIIGYLEGRVRFWPEAQGLYALTPAQAKSFATNDKLRAIGWYDASLDHGMDACRHLLTWFCTTPQGRLAGGELILRRLIDAQV